MTRKSADTTVPPSETTSSTAPANMGGTVQSSTGNSDEALVQDSAAIDTQMQALGADSTAASQTPQ